MPALIDEAGKRYGRLTVIKRVGNRRGKACWLCLCDCGNKTIVRGDHLRSGHTRSCGCLQFESLINEIGNRYGRLTVIGRAENDKKGGARWRCQCDCGRVVIVQGSSLRQGRTKSCGCLTALPEEQAACNYLYAQYRAGAQHRGYKFELTKAEFKKIIQQPCYYCGREPARRLLRYSNFAHNGLDRLDSNKGYTRNNVVPCCPKCNYAKQSMTVQEFADWIRRAYEHFAKHLD